MKGFSTRIKKRVNCIFDGLDVGHCITAQEMGRIVENLTEEYDLQYFSECYPSRPTRSKGVTQVEFQMKQLELMHKAKRCGVLEWVKI